MNDNHSKQGMASVKKKNCPLTYEQTPHTLIKNWKRAWGFTETKQTKNVERAFGGKRSNKIFALMLCRTVVHPLTGAPTTPSLLLKYINSVLVLHLQLKTRTQHDYKTKEYYKHVIMRSPLLDKLIFFPEHAWVIRTRSLSCWIFSRPKAIANRFDPKYRKIIQNRRTSTLQERCVRVEHAVETVCFAGFQSTAICAPNVSGLQEPTLPQGREYPSNQKTPYRPGRSIWAIMFDPEGQLTTGSSGNAKMTTHYKAHLYTRARSLDTVYTTIMC